MITEWNDKELIKEVSNIVEVATKEGAEIVMKDAIRIVKKRSGTLSREIDIRKSRYKDGGYVVQAQGPSNYSRYYASFVELGTHKDPKQPFLRPALKRNRRKIAKNFENKLK